MAITSKTQLQSDITASTFTAPQKTILGNIVDSYEDIFPQLTTVQRDALTPTNGLVIYNTDNDRYEYWNGVVWYGIGQDLSTPLCVKVSLSSADILALHTTDIVVATATGAGYALIPTSMAYRFTYGTVQYASGGGSEYVALMCSTQTLASGTHSFLNLDEAVIKAAANRSGTVPANIGSSGDSIVENDSLILRAKQAFTTGDGTLTVWVTYSIIVY